MFMTFGKYVPEEQINFQIIKTTTNTGLWFDCRLFIYTMILAAIPFCVSAQSDSVESFTSFVLAGPTVVLDSNSIVPESFMLEGLSPDQYNVDFAKGVLTITDNALNYPIEIKVRFETFPFNFTTPYQHKDLDLILESDRIYNPFRSQHAVNSSKLVDLGDLEKRGSVSRGITVGNSQNLSVNSSLNLQLSGQLNERFSLVAAITDDNIPIQPEGNTQQLQDFDQVYLQIYDPKNRITAGDFQVAHDRGYFMRFNKKLQGGRYETKFTPLAEDSSKAIYTDVSGAVSRGKFARQIIQGGEGNQGPYRLVGSEGERFIVVLSGTERVYIDGRLLVRGQENDYVVNYNTSEVTFTAKMPITKDRRIVVEFQYSDRNYARSLLYSETGYSSDRLQMNLSLYSEQDSKNQPLQQDLTDVQKDVLRSIGDSLDLAIASSIDTASFNENQLLYLKVDSMYFDPVRNDSFLEKDVLIYTTSSEGPLYKASFSEVGAGNGNYVKGIQLAFGRVYEWVAPIGGVPQGNFEPVVFLVTPKQRQMVAVSAVYDLTENIQATIEWAGSQYDVNTFSSSDKSDDLGMASKINIGGSQPINGKWRAIAGLDYSTLNETVTFAPGETNKAVTVSIIDDDIDEVNEVFNVIALSPVNTVIASSESAPNGILNVLIEDNDDAPTINLSDDFSVSEDANTAVVEFNLSQVSGKRISFNYATQSTNQNASLFNAKSGVVNFEPGESSKSVTINLIDNNVYSGVDGEFILKISNASNAIIVDDTTKVTVVEDEAKPTLSISDVTVNEGDVATLTITQSGRTSADTTFIYKSSDGSATLANDDYETVSGLEVTIPAGLSVATFNINTNDDDVYEGNENLLIEIYQTSTPNLVDIGSGLEAEITIIDNDPLPSVSITDSLSSRTEGQGLALNFSKSGATELEVTFDLQISTIDAEADDYEVITSQISILPNETSLTNEVLRAIDDLVDEDDERLLISITNLQNAELGSITSHTLTIIDNDSPPILSLSNTNDISLVEGNSVSLNFVLSNTSEKPISFRYTTIAGTAVSGEEFEFNSEEITIPVGETSASVQINTLDDLVDETESKSFTVQISSLDNVTTELTEIPITVLDNDSAPLLSASITDITEGESATISFNLSSISEKVVTFDVASVSGSAISGTDFSLLSESITINPGSSSASVTLVTIDDAIDEVNETIGIQLSNLVNLLDETQTSYTLSVIDNDDAPVLVFSGRDINENVGTFDVLFSISEVSAKDIAFDVNSVADTASDADYNNISSTLTIPAGELSVSQSLTIIDDEIDEDNETFDITVSNLENVTATTLTEAFRIIDNDGVPNIIINNASITEGQSVEIPVNLSNVSELDIAIDYVTTDATAKAGTDYEASSGTLLISAGETDGVILIKTIDDQLDEEDKSLTLTLSNPQNATLSKSSIQVGIFDNDETPTVTAANKINEEGETVSISFALSEESGRDISFNYATNNGTAIAGIDYTSQSSSITFAAGESIKTINVVTLDDSLDEDRENFTVSLSNPTNVKLGTSVIEIALDDNDEEPTVSINGSNASEGSNSATAVISLSSASGKVITVDYLAFEANSAKAIEDFIPVSSSITFAPGEIQKTIAIDLVNDTIREASESFDISLGNIINAVASVNDTVSIVIEDDDLPPTIAISDASVLEDVGSINVTVSLSNVSSETISVDVDTLNGSAISGIDYTEYSNTLIFNPGETSKSVTLSILADTLDEFDESFNVVISNPSNASIANESAKVTIIDSDLAPAISLVAPVSINEGQNAEYAITLSKISAKDISFDYEVSGVSSNDVLVTSGSVNIPAGSQTASFVVTSLEDNLIEANEVIEISLNNAQNVQIGSSTYRTQLINTTVAKINISDVSVNESAGSASLTISLSATPDEKVEVDYKTSTQSTASALQDYTPVSGTLVFSAGETSKTIVIEILDDQLDESNEIITILLSTPVNAVIEDGSGSVEIVDNDITSIIINAGRYDESINPEIIVSLTSEETQTISLDYEFIGNTAVAGEDFVANSGTLTFNPGEISKFITLDLIDDGVRENDELITFRISNPVNASTPVTNTTITILDNDVDQAATINVLPAKEGEKLEIFISLDFAPETAAEYDYFTRNNSAGDEDYIGKSGTIIFNPGETEKTIQIDIIDDDIKEESESFDFVLRHSVLGEQTKAINLRDNDSLNVSVLDGSADESAGEGLIEVNLSNPSASDTEVAYQIINKATGEIVDQNTINITAGKTSEFISLPIVDDELDEYDEEFEVLITNSNADYIDDGLAKFTVFDNDVTPTVSINSVNVAENIGTVDVTIELSAQSGRSILVGYTTEDDTALAGTEYYAKSGIFTFSYIYLYVL